MSESRDDNRRIKDPAQYDALRDEGMSKEKAARIANTDRDTAGHKGGRHPEYADWSIDALYEKAQQIGIGQRSEMSKDELIRALRDH